MSLVIRGLAKRLKDMRKTKDSLSRAKKELRDMTKEFHQLKFDLVKHDEDMLRKKFYESNRDVVVVIKVNFENGECNVGSGVVVRKDGLILTSCHNLKSKKKSTVDTITVTLSDETVHSVDIFCEKNDYNLLLLKVIIKKQDFKVVHFAKPESVVVGTDVHLIFHPYNNKFSFLTGGVSYARRNKSIFLLLKGAANVIPEPLIALYEEFNANACIVQTSVPKEEGSLGGGLLNWQGELVGILFFNHGCVSLGIHIKTIMEFVEPHIRRTARLSESASNQPFTFTGASNQPFTFTASH